MAVYQFGGRPESEFETGLLQGFNSNALSGPDYDTERARKLYESIDADTSDDEYTLGVLPSGRWAVVGLTLPGCEFAVED